MREKKFKKMQMVQENRQRKMGKHSRGLAALAAAFGVVAFWRGSWMLMDIYLFPHNPTLSAVVSLVGGIVTILVLNYKLTLRTIYPHPSNDNAYDARRKGSGVAKATFSSFQRCQHVRYRLTPKGRHHRRTIASLRRHQRSFSYALPPRLALIQR